LENHEGNALLIYGRRRVGKTELIKTKGQPRFISSARRTELKPEWHSDERKECLAVFAKSFSK